MNTTIEFPNVEQIIAFNISSHLASIVYRDEKGVKKRIKHSDWFPEYKEMIQWLLNTFVVVGDDKELKLNVSFIYFQTGDSLHAYNTAHFIYSADELINTFMELNIPSEF